MREENAAVTPKEFVRQVDVAYRAAADATLAEPMSKYMRSLFPFVGLQKPKQSAALKPVLVAAKPFVDEQFLIAASKALYQKQEREFHYAALLTLIHFEKKLSVASLGHVRWLVETHSWWDTVDTLATHVVGGLVLRYPKKLQPEMDEWSADANFWIRRCAILHQLSYKTKTDAERLFAYCAANARDEEFFIRKAIGWALRQYSRTDARAVAQFVHEHPELSALSRREAMKLGL
ncbi:hypothetical protein F183_A49780 [Bryobacterales bacterium F-183]|nr:hypothetical protein F183_A49780 [Bryobacterales bacterium F-183]